MKKIIKYILLTAVFIILLLNPETASRAVINSTNVSVSRIIPSIFPFMVLSELIINSFGNKNYVSNKRCAILPAAVFPLILLGNVSGFPLGAKNSAKLYECGVISEKQAYVCAILSGNASISFVISFVGANLFSSKKAGLALYFCQLAASMLTALICTLVLKNKNKRLVPLRSEAEANRGFEESFIDSVSGAALACLTVTAFITVFGIIIEFVCMFCYKLSFGTSAVALIASVLEISNGCLKSASLETPFSYVICAFAVGFSGLSVMFQSTSFFNKSEIGSLPFICFKLLQGILSSLIAFFVFGCSSIDFKTAITVKRVSSQKHGAEVVLLFFCLLYLLFVLKKFTLKRAYRKERT